MNVNFKYYKALYHVCACGNLTAVIQELCISQPAISQAVQQLEKGAGTKLFLCTSKRVQLTREKELPCHYVKPGVEELLEGGRILERILNMDVGEVRIGASNVMLQFYLLPYLEQFRREYPKIKVDVINAPTPEIIKSLEKDRIGFGVVTPPFTSRGTVRQFQIKAVRNVFIAGNSLRELERRELEYKELEALPYITLEKNTSTRTFMDAFLTQQGTLLKPEFKLTISDMTVQFARRSMEIGYVMEGFTKDAIMGGEIFRLEFKHEMSLRHMYVVMGESNLISMLRHRLLGMMTYGQTVTEQPAGGRR